MCTFQSKVFITVVDGMNYNHWDIQKCLRTVELTAVEDGPQGQNVQFNWAVICYVQSLNRGTSCDIRNTAIWYIALTCYYKRDTTVEKH